MQIMTAIFLEDSLWFTFGAMLGGREMCKCEQASLHWLGATNGWLAAAPIGEPLPAGWATLLSPDAAAVPHPIFFEDDFWTQFRASLGGRDYCICEQVSPHWMCLTNGDSCAAASRWEAAVQRQVVM